MHGSDAFRIKYNEENINEVEEFLDTSIEKRIFLISSVRGAAPDEIAKVIKYIDSIKSRGFQVYYPSRHTFQDTPSILTIMNTNKYIIKHSGKIHIFYNPASEGSVVDLGMTFANQKKLTLANPEVLRNKLLDYISLFVKKYSNHTLKYGESTFVNKMLEEKQRLTTLDEYVVTWNGRNKEDLFKLGMAFGFDLPIVLANKKDVVQTEKKSPENFLLELDARYSSK